MEKSSPVDNTPLSEEELEYFKKKLHIEKEKAELKIQQLKSDLDELSEVAADNQSAQDHHQADIASMESRKTTLFSQIEQEYKKLDQITIALDRIADGNYGICIETGRAIQKERLEFMPYAIRSVVAKR